MYDQPIITLKNKTIKSLVNKIIEVPRGMVKWDPIQIPVMSHGNAMLFNLFKILYLI